MSSKRILFVASDIQVAVFTQVLMPEICNGFWKDAKPQDHASYWDNVSVQTGPNLGASGFEIPRNYNFVNPEFFKAHETRLMEVAKTVNPEITVKQLKKQLISLNQIIGNRLKEVGGSITKLSRGKKTNGQTTKSTSNVRRATAQFTEEA